MKRGIRHAVTPFPPAPRLLVRAGRVRGAGSPGDTAGEPAPRAPEFAAHGIGGGLAPLPGLPVPPLRAARCAVGAVFVTYGPHTFAPRAARPVPNRRTLHQ